MSKIDSTEIAKTLDWDKIVSLTVDSILHSDFKLTYSISGWQKVVHKLAVEKGWWPEGAARSDVELISLMICEATEAIEEIRNNKPDYYEIEGKPEGQSVELADMIIRALDYAESKGWDMQDIIAKKHEFNKNRPARHGGKKL